MEDNLESVSYEMDRHEESPSSGWMRVGVVAVASALVGGLAAAWFYHKTLAKLRSAEEENQHSEYGISDYDSGDGI